MSNTTRYRGVAIVKTKVTTEARRMAFGRPYTAIVEVYRLEDRLSKPEGLTPFLTTVAECRAYIDGALDTLPLPLIYE